MNQPLCIYSGEVPLLDSLVCLASSVRAPEVQHFSGIIPTAQSNKIFPSIFTEITAEIVSPTPGTTPMIGEIPNLHITL
ncbi:hypothetical protein Pelo_5145 [Pelomyxa schiedti]|nr:hypothetical protein Pelo_5145 [Pelomyxa schiedti]